MKVWARLIINGKNVKDTIIDDSRKLTFNNYEIMLREVADKLDIPSPVSMKIHYNHLIKFNNHRFKSEDFVESFDYDRLEIELF